METANPYISIARSFLYAVVLFFYIFWGDSNITNRVIWISLFSLLILFLLEVFQRWPRTSQHGKMWAALIDFILISIFTLWIDPALSLLYNLMIVVDGIFSGWKVTLLLGLGIIAMNTVLWLINSIGQFQPREIYIYFFFQLALAGIATVIAIHLEQEYEARKKLEKNVRIRSDRLSMLSHEIRTPLTLMRTSLELLFAESAESAGSLTEQQRYFLETIYQNEERIDSLAQNLLTQAKLEAGVFSPKIQYVDFRTIIRRAVNDLRILIEQRKQQIRTYYPQVLPPVPVDPNLIHQVLINLIQNASRYSSEGGCIFVSVSENDRNLLVSVTDDGTGMGYEYRRQLFRHFSTADANFGEGTGLGLVIVKQIVERHGGQIYVDTSLGKGTSFYITLPLENKEMENERNSYNIDC